MKLILIFVCSIFFGAGCASTVTQKTHMPEALDLPASATTSGNSIPAVPTSHPISLPALARKELRGTDFKVGHVLAREAAYTRYYITYKSGDLTISGIMNVPDGGGPFPVLILNHGHIDTSVYTNGRGLRREQDYLARAGFLVVHPDYRNHAQSSKDDRDEIAVRLGYVEDVLNVIISLRSAKLPYADTNHVGMLGHSMGGGITLAALVTRPDLIDAAVLYAPVSGNMEANYERWMSRRPDSATKISDLYGDPSASPAFWSDISAETFYDRITAPIAIFHGTRDESVPLEWSERTRDLLRERGKDITFTVYQDAPHEFAGDWPLFMQDVKDFFGKEI